MAEEIAAFRSSVALEAECKAHPLHTTHNDTTTHRKGNINVYQKNFIAGAILRTGYKTLLSLIPQNRLGDKLFSFIYFVIRHKRLPTNTLLFNDVLYKIKTTDEILNPLRVFVSDKEFVKIYVKAVVSDKYNVRTIDVIRRVEDVDGYTFPSDCCIKPTHASGRVILRRNNGPIDKAEIKSWFSINHYKAGREANYETLQPKVIIEPLIFNNANAEDYKFFCYNGKPKLIQVDIDRYVDHTRSYFDTNWNELDFSIIYPKSQNPAAKPNNFDEMRAVATDLSLGFSVIRVDLYSDGNDILVGELTNVSENAGGIFRPEAAELYASRVVFE